MPGVVARVVARLRVLGIGGGERPRLRLVVDVDARVRRQRDRRQRGVATGAQRLVVAQRAHADPRCDRAGVARGELGLGHLRAARRVDVAAAVALAPVAHQAAQPGQLADRGRRGRAVDLELEAGGAPAARAQLTATDDHHEVGGIELVRRGGRAGGGGPGDVGVDPRQRADDRLLLRRIARAVELGAAPRVLGLPAQLGGQRRDRRVHVVDGAEAAGQVDLHGRRRRPLAQRPRPGQCRQQPAHLGGGERPHAEALLDERRNGVVCPHEPRAAHPADARRDESHPRAPRGVLAVPASQQHLERGLPVAVGAVAAEGAVVGRQRQEHGGRGRAGRDARGDRPDEPLHAEQLQAQRDLGVRAGVTRRAGGGDRGERGDDRRRERIEAQVGPFAGGRPRLGEPRHQGVDVGERREVGGQHVQLGAGCRREPVQIAVPAPPGRRVGG
ncbi:MAG: hypothetical protein Q8K79_05395, partial [Solirubrobacteraceae bacterium]|nr:hypothetical protein [Solirubrobacteraceae bacterium]